MNRFATALANALDELQWTQTDAAELAKIPRQQFNKYVTGNIVAGGEIAEQICVALPPPQRAKVIVAYLEDKIPASGRELIKIATSVGKSGAVPRMPNNLPAGVRDAIESIARVSMLDESTRNLVLALADLLAHRDQ